MKTSRMPRRKWGAGRGSLFVIASLLIASGLVRLGAGTGQAIAKEISALTTTPELASQAQFCETDPDLAEVLKTVLAREAELGLQEAAFSERKKSLEISDREVRANLKALQDAEQKLAATMALADTAAESDIERLTSVYENMKPKDAATLFEQMAPEFAAGFLGRMRPEAAAQVMAGLSPKIAYSISVIIAGRNADVPKQ